MGRKVFFAAKYLIVADVHIKHNNVYYIIANTYFTVNAYFRIDSPTFIYLFIYFSIRDTHICICVLLTIMKMSLLNMKHLK